jgi:hypothetical protein
MMSSDTALRQFKRHVGGGAHGYAVAGPEHKNVERHPGESRSSQLMQNLYE